jgi:hypothetical protein
MIKSSELRNNRRHKKLGAIQELVVGYIFLGTPHRGSPLANLGLIVANIAKASGFRPNKKLVSSLQQESPILEQQRDSFVSITEKVPITCFFEEKAMTAGMVSDAFICIDIEFTVTGRSGTLSLHGWFLCYQK